MERFNLRNGVATFVRQLGLGIGFFAMSFSFVKVAICAEPPAVLFTDLERGPNYGGDAITSWARGGNSEGAFLTIFGRRFGYDINRLKVTIGPAEVGAYCDLGTNGAGLDYVTVQIGASVSGIDQPIRVCVDAVCSNTDQKFTVSSGEIFFISGSGSDNNDGRTLATPIFSFPRANDIARVTKDDAIFYIRAKTGGYTESTGEQNKAMYFRGTEEIGTASHRVSFIGYPGEKVVMSPSSGNTIKMWASKTNTLSYYTFAKLHCLPPGTGGSCFSWEGGDHLRVIGMTASNMHRTGGGSGIISCGGGGDYMQCDDIKILGNEIYDVGDTNLYHGVYIASGGDPIEIAYNKIHDVKGGRGIQLYTSASRQYGARNAYIHDNVIYNTDRDGIVLGNYTEGPAYVYNNVIYNAGRVSQTGIKLGSGGSDSHPAGERGNFYILNNTLYHDGDNSGSTPAAFGIVNLDPNSTVYFSNNIVVSAQGESYTRIGDRASQMVSSNNLWYGNGKPPTWASNELNVDPLMADAPRFDFSLSSTSPAVDKGSSNHLNVVNKDIQTIDRPYGQGVDIGAYEYVPGFRPRSGQYLRLTEKTN